MTKSELKAIISECVAEQMAKINEAKELEELGEFEEATVEVQESNNFLVDLMEYEIPSFDEEVETVEEGANLDMRAEFKKMKPQIKQNLKDLKKAIKAKDKAEAKKLCAETISNIDKLEKAIKDCPSTAGSVIFGFYTAFSITYIRDLIICLFVPLGAPVLSLQKMVNDLRQLIADIKDSKASAADVLNSYRRRLLSQVHLMKMQVQKAQKKIDKMAD